MDAPLTEMLSAFALLGFEIWSNLTHPGMPSEHRGMRPHSLNTAARALERYSGCFEKKKKK